MRNAVSAHRENKKNKTRGQISGFIIWSCFWHPRETAFRAEIHFVICTNVLYMCIHYLKPEHTKKDNGTKRRKIQTLRMLFMENTFLPLVLIFSADSVEWPADETLPRHKQRETHHTKWIILILLSSFFRITRHARSNMTHRRHIFHMVKLGKWLVERSVCHIQKPANDISLQSVEPVDLFFPVGKPSDVFGGWGLAGGKTILTTLTSVWILASYQ